MSLYHHLYGLNYISLRISNAYGERQNPNSLQGAVSVFLGKIKKNIPLEIWGEGEVIRDYIYTKDIVDAAIQAAETDQTDHHVINIGSGVGISLIELIETLRQITGKNIQIKYKEKRKIDVPINILDISVAKIFLCWEPKYSLSNGVKKILDNDYFGSF